jgi:hypothetical protein
MVRARSRCVAHMRAAYANSYCRTQCQCAMPLRTRRTYVRTDGDTLTLVGDCYVEYRARKKAPTAPAKRRSTL